MIVVKCAAADATHMHCVSSDVNPGSRTRASREPRAIPCHVLVARRVAAPREAEADADAGSSDLLFLFGSHLSRVLFCCVARTPHVLQLRCVLYSTVRLILPVERTVRE